jgi:hypothetical protein
VASSKRSLVAHGRPQLTLPSCSLRSKVLERCLFQQEQEDRDKYLRPPQQSSDTIVTINNLAFACDEAGFTERAVELYERCLEALEEGMEEASEQKPPKSDMLAAKEMIADTAENLGSVLLNGGEAFAAKLEALRVRYPGVGEEEQEEEDEEGGEC